MKYILNYHGLAITGTRDELVLRLRLLKEGQYYLAFYKEQTEILNTINDAEQLVLEERHDYLNYSNDVYRRRTYDSWKESTPKDTNNTELEVKDLHKIFKKLKDYIMILRDMNKNKGKDLKKKSMHIDSELELSEGSEESIFRIGTKVKWCGAHVKGTGWKPGWYIAYVQSADPLHDHIVVEHSAEPSSLYTLDVSPLIAEGSLKLG